jgi:alkylation response protein AidB-like acyl-CoA dehydrogenase
VLLNLTPDQEVFRETTSRFLAKGASAEIVRGLREHPTGFEPDYWRAGAELGWTSLLVEEEHGGGSISGAGLVDLTLAAHEFGVRAAPGPLVASNVVAATLSTVGGAHLPVLESIMAGESIVSWCLAGPVPLDRLGAVGVSWRRDGGDLVLDGVSRPVEAAGSADHLLVTASGGDGPTQLLVPAGAPGVTITPLRTVDLTRRFSTVRFDGVRVGADTVVGELGGARDLIERQLRQAIVILNAESVGAMQTAFDLTVKWAFERYSFGRPLASYQALKHRFADMKSWLEAAHGISDTAAAAVAEQSPQAGELVSAAKAFVGTYGAELLQDCVQLHGGIGVTFEHDLHLYLRRVTLNRALFGTPAEHRQRVADVVEHLKEQA